MSEQITRPMRAAGIVAQEMLPWLDTTHAAGLPLNVASLNMIVSHDVLAADDDDRRRRGLLLLASQAMLMVAAMDEP